VKILYFDGMNAMWRANIKFGKSKSDADDSFAMTFNFIRNLKATVEQFSPDKVYFVLEGHPEFRYQLLASYKANRIVKTAAQQEVRDLFRENKYKIYEILDHLPMTVISHAKYECDDVINTLVRKNKEHENIVISNDSDYLQLLQEKELNVQIYNPFSKKFMEAPTYDYVRFKSLKGDTADNIPGIMGEKKAEKTVIKENFVDLLNEEELSIYQRNMILINFVTIKDSDSNDWKVKEGVFDLEKLSVKFSELGFNSLLQEKYLNKFKDVWIKIMN
jgi:5'-3' exonuclease